ncbi:MAG: oligosaccharide flippase family protein, partial [Candidatus Woesearchaeota archaeon]
SDDIDILTYFRSLKEVALYNVALPTANLLRYIPRAFSVSILPISAHLYINNKKQLSATITQTYRYLFLLMVPLAMIFFSFSKEIINILFGSDFIEASTALSILAVSMIFNTIYLVNQNIIISINKPGSYVKFLFLEALISTILDLLLIPKFGIIGAATTAVIASLSLLLYSSIIIKKQILNYIPYKAWLKTFLAGFLTLGLIYIMKVNINMSFYFEAIIISFSAVVFYLIIIFIFKLVTFDEIKNIFLKILPNK